MIAAGALVVAVAAGTLLLVLDGDESPSPAGDSVSQAPTEIDAEPSPVATDAAETTTTEPTTATKPREDRDDDGAGGSPPESKRSAASGTGGDQQEGSAGPGRPVRDRDRDRDPNRSFTCPPGLNHDQCAALAGDIGTTESKPAEGCPEALSGSQCAALQEDSEAARPGNEWDTRQCPPGLTQQQCELVAEAIQSGS